MIGLRFGIAISFGASSCIENGPRTLQLSAARTHQAPIVIKGVSKSSTHVVTVRAQIVNGFDPMPTGVAGKV
jgi:hypothetical protein